MSEQAPTVAEDDVQWYTPARKVPRYIGKPPGGGTYPFGPYTIPQFVGGAIVFAIGAWTEGLWGGDSWLMNKVILFAVTAAFIAAMKVIKPGGRGPVLAVPAYLRGAMGTPHGRYRGSRVKAPRSHRVSHGTIHACLDPHPQLGVGDSTPNPIPETPFPSSHRSGASTVQQEAV